MKENCNIVNLFFYFWKRKIILLFAILIGILLGFIFTRFVVAPKYSSSISFIISRYKDSYIGSIDNQSDHDYTKKLLATYNEIIKSKKVINTVSSKLKLDISYEVLKNEVKMVSLNDTDVLSIVVTTPDANISKEVASEVYRTFTSEVDRIYNIKNIAVIDEAEEDTNPTNRNYSLYMVLFGLVFLLIAMAILYIIHRVTGKFSKEYDIEKEIGLPVLAVMSKTSKKENKKRAINNSKEKGGKKNA